MIQIEITNFQAIDRLTLEIEGFTALVGRSNIGKSSVVRALKCALSGSSGSDFVRHDAQTCSRLLTQAKSCKCFASVKLTFGEGQALLWEKGARGINRYTVWKDGVESVYDRVGQGIELPDFLDARFAPAKLGANESLLQVSSQFDPPFLLDLSGPAVANILSDIGQLDDINHALSAVAKDRRTAISTRKVREGDIVTLNDELAPYATLDAHLVRIRELQAREGQIGVVAARFELADRLITGVVDSAKTLRRLTLAVEPKLPECQPIAAASRRLHQAGVLLEGWASRTVAVAALIRVLEPALPNPEGVGQASRRRAQLVAFEASLVQREGLVTRLGKVGGLTLPSHSALQAKVARAGLVGSWLARLAELKDSFAKGVKLGCLPATDPSPLVSALKRLSQVDRFRNPQGRLEAEISKLEQALAECTQHVEGILAEFSELGLCPTCHQGINLEHVVHA